jgi:small subunit ribosomal protein S20
MANTSSARKAAVQTEKRRLVNAARKTALKTAMKKVLVALEEKRAVAEVQTLLSSVAAQLARAKSKQVIHRNTAANKLSRLAKKVAAYGRTAKA